jgi:hypothetical protein
MVVLRSNTSHDRSNTSQRVFLCKCKATARALGKRFSGGIYIFEKKTCKTVWQLKINMYFCTLKTNKVMTRKNIISLHILPPSSIWFLGKNNFDERYPMATSVAVGM